MITSLIDVDDERGGGDFVFGQNLLDFSMEGVSHFTKEDNWVDGVGFGLYEFEILGSVISGWVKVEDGFRVEGLFGIKWG